VTVLMTKVYVTNGSQITYAKRSSNTSTAEVLKLWPEGKWHMKRLREHLHVSPVCPQLRAAIALNSSGSAREAN